MSAVRTSSSAEFRAVRPSGDGTRSWKSIPLSVVAAVLAGGLTSIGQAGFPFVATLANSAGAWFVIAVALVFAVRTRVGWSIGLGIVFLELMHVGYWATTVLRGIPDSLSITNVWVLLGIPAGVLAGIVGSSLVDGRASRRSAALVVSASVLLGEGVRGALVVGATTSVGYWIAEIGVGAIALAVGSLLARTAQGRVVAALLGLAGTVMILGAYLALTLVSQ